VKLAENDTLEKVDQQRPSLCTNDRVQVSTPNADEIIEKMNDRLPSSTDTRVLPEGDSAKREMFL